MSTNSKKIYSARNTDGFLCAYDSSTHLCVGVMLSTGDNIELYKQKHNEYIGQLAPKYKSNN
jgi:hypothetical protein